MRLLVDHLWSEVMTLLKFLRNQLVSLAKWIWARLPRLLYDVATDVLADIIANIFFK